MIFLMTGHAAHGQRLLAPRDRHRVNIAMAIAANFFYRLALAKNKALDVALVIETHKVRKVVNLLPGNRFLGIPVFE